jgi:hypothetical protein
VNLHHATIRPREVNLHHATIRPREVSPAMAGSSLAK